MKSLFTKERPKTNEERLYDWKQRKRGNSSNESSQKLLNLMIGLAIIGMILSVSYIVYISAESVQVVYPIIP